MGELSTLRLNKPNSLFRANFSNQVKNTMNIKISSILITTVRSAIAPNGISGERSIEKINITKAKLVLIKVTKQVTAALMMIRGKKLDTAPP